MQDYSPDIRVKFSEIVAEQYVSLKRFAISLCQNEFNADDLVSETFLKAFRNFSKLKDEKKVKQWLFRILNNQFISDHRRNKKTVEINFGNYENDKFNSFSLFETLSESDFVNEENPEVKFINKLSNAEIKDAINELPDEFRVTLTLCDVEDFSYNEISEILNVPIGTVRSRIARARSILQKKLWKQAQEMGIKISKKPKEKPEYTCTCGKEEGAIPDSNVITV